MRLFNGKDSSGWRLLGNARHSWSVSRGLLEGVAGAPPSSTLTTVRTDFANFHLRVEMMVVEGLTSGIWLRMTEPDSERARRYSATIAPARPDGKKTLHNMGSLLFDAMPGPAITLAEANPGVPIVHKSLVPNAAIFFGGATWTDYTFSAEVQLVESTGHAGLFFRHGGVRRRGDYIYTVPPKGDGLVLLWRYFGGEFHTSGAECQGGASPHGVKRALIDLIACSSAAWILSGDLPPAWARSGRPPPPPPTIGATSLSQLPACRPRSIRSLDRPGNELDLAVGRGDQQDGQVCLVLTSQDVDQLAHVVGRRVLDRVDHDGRAGDFLGGSPASRRRSLLSRSPGGAGSPVF